MTLYQLYAKQNAQRTNVKEESTRQGRKKLMRTLGDLGDILGAKNIDSIRLSGAKEWAITHERQKGLCLSGP